MNPHRYVNQIPPSHSPYLHRLIKAQENRCAYCHVPMDEPGRANPRTGKISGYSATLDHVWPKHARRTARFRAYGRRGKQGNSVAACYRCNARKGGREPCGCHLVTLEWVNARLSSPPVIRTVRNG